MPEQVEAQENPSPVPDRAPAPDTAVRPVARRVVTDRLTIQAKLTVGSADDPSEREADEMADRVVRSLSGSEMVDRTHTAAGGQSRIRRAASGAGIGAAGGDVDRATERVIQSAKGGGSALPAGPRAQMERSIGADFGGVRVHTGPQAAELNSRIQASAFTTGNDIFFRDGFPDTSRASGQHLLAHELTHTVQQGSSPTRDASTVSPSRTRAQRQIVQRVLSPNSTDKKDWNHLATGKTGSGVNGVIFATNNAGEQIVVKGLQEPPQRAMLAQEMMVKSGLATTLTKPVAVGSSLGKHILTKLGELGAAMTQAGNAAGAQITAKAAAWQGYQSLLLMEPANVKNLVELASAQGPGLAPVTAPPVWQGAQPTGANGPAPVPANVRQAAADLQANVQLHQNYWTTLLGNANFWNHLGRMFFIDQFLGNEDRLESMKIQNVFIDDTGQLVAMDNDTMAADYIRRITTTDATTNPHNPVVDNADTTPDQHIQGMIEGGRSYGEIQDREMASVQLIAGKSGTIRATTNQKVLDLLNALHGGMAGPSPNHVGGRLAIAALIAAPGPAQAQMGIGAIAARDMITQMFNDAVGRQKSSFEKLFEAQKKAYKTGKSPNPMYNYLSLEIRFAYLQRRSMTPPEDHATALAAVQAAYRAKVQAMAKTATAHVELDQQTFNTSYQVDSYD